MCLGIKRGQPLEYKFWVLINQEDLSVGRLQMKNLPKRYLSNTD